MHYKLAIFDLDNCLLDARAVGPLFEPAFEAIRQAHRQAHPCALQPDVLEQALHQCWFTAFDLVADRFGFTPAMRAAGMQQFSQVQVRAPLQGYPDIALVPLVPLRRYLVTSGFRRLQDSKIDALGIRHWFEQVIIDAIDEPHTPPAAPAAQGTAHGKQPIFEQIMAREGCTPQQTLVIGDNPLSELGAGRALGAITVQTVRPRVSPWALADHQVDGLEGLLRLLSAPPAPLPPPPSSATAGAVAMAAATATAEKNQRK